MSWELDAMGVLPLSTQELIQDKRGGIVIFSKELLVIELANRVIELQNELLEKNEWIHTGRS